MKAYAIRTEEGRILVNTVHSHPRGAIVNGLTLMTGANIPAVSDDGVLKLWRQFRGTNNVVEVSIHQIGPVLVIDESNITPAEERA